jgi:hypothetical protein
VYATRKFRTTVNKQTKLVPKYDSVQVLFQGEDDDSTREPVCQVLALLCITSVSNNEKTFLLVVTELAVMVKKDADRFLPYEQLKYSCHYTGLADISVIDARSVFRPAILVPCPDRSQNMHKNFNRKSQGGGTPSIRFWGIKYNTLDRTGYECPTLPLPPHQMNELQATIKRARAGANMIGYMDHNDHESNSSNSDDNTDDDSDG